MGLASFTLTGAGLIVGLVVEVLTPSPAHAATMDAYYLTPVGFQQFLNLTEEQQRMHLERSPELAQLVESLAEIVRAAQAADYQYLY